MEQHIRQWLLFALGALSAYVSSFIGIVLLFLVLFVTDFLSGCVASYLAGEDIRSHKLRWSAVKTFCYFGAFGFTALTGVCTGNMELFIGLIKLQIYVALWIEAVSITENLMRIFPGVVFIEYLHYMLGSVWVKKLAGLIDFLKEKKEKK